MKRLPMKLVVLPLLAFAFLALPAGAPAGAPELLWQVPAAGPASGSAAGQIRNPFGIDVDPSSGHVFVADNFNQRISEFTPWGEFVKAFGWKVNASAPVEGLQVCTAETGCQAGTEGGGSGQFRALSGLAIGASGNVYVYDVENRRVTVFEPDGSFVLMFGAEVNQTKVEAAAPEAQQNRCPVDPGDVCKAGVAGTGPGEFSTGDFLADYIDAGPGGSIYVGDVGRIQKFDANGNFTGEIKGEAAGGTVNALEVDENGNSYAVINTGGADVQGPLLKLGPAGEKLLTYEASNPAFDPRYGLALADSGNLYAVNDPFGNSFGTAGLEPRIVEFDAAGDKVLPTEEEEEAEKELGEEPIPPEPFIFGQVFGLGSQYKMIGLATSSACGIEGEDIFASYARFPLSLLRAYGPNPDPSICPPPPVAPSIVDTYAISVDTAEATVQAKVNSHFWPDTTYYVEYGTGKCSEGGCDKEQPIAPGSALGSDSGVAVPTAGVFLTGLAPGTTYHYRFVAQSGGGGPTNGPEATLTTAPLALPLETDCPNQAFRAGRSAALPGCRAYEMVSPVDKEGGEVLDLVAPLEELRASIQQSSLSGDRFTYSAYRAWGEDAKGAPYISQYLASRGADGWSNANISPPRGRPRQFVVNTNNSEYKAFSPDLCHGWLRFDMEPDPPLDPDEVAAYPNLYRHDLCGGGGYEALTTVFPPHEPSIINYTLEVQGHSADGRCTAFRTEDSLVPGAPFPGNVLYESCAGTLRLVAVLPDGTPAPGASSAGIASEAGGTGFEHRTSNVAGAVSADGTRIYWTAAEVGAGNLYLRINADREQSEVSGGECTEAAKACTRPVSVGSARFWAASEDGSRAIFTEGEKLFEYVVEEEEGELVDEVFSIADGVQGLLGASEDAKRIYFVSKKALGGEGTAGQPNLYYRDTESEGEAEVEGEPVFVATLASDDVTGSSWLALSPQPNKRASRVTPDGLHAVFMSTAPLTGYDNTDQANAGAPLKEVFLYDATAGEGEGSLACLSCEPGGARPVGRDIDPFGTVWAAARIPTWPAFLHGPRIISDDGSRVFFDSFGPLVQRDTNGKADVYEWQSASSEAACEEAGAARYVEASGGCLSLISSGDAPQDSTFLDASSDGEDVFFLTASSLLSQDPGLIDVYDARAGGGLPPPPGPPPGCEGEACQNAAPPPNDATPASASFKGQGNPRPASTAARRCPKGSRKVAKRGKVRCAKRKRLHRNASGKRRSHR